jgi:hypothetical protein
MRATAALFAPLLAFAAAGPAQAAEEGTATVLELVDQGLWQCDHPSARQKTCRAVAIMERIREGVYNSTTVMALGRGITLEVYTPVWVKDDALCNTVREQDIMTGTIRVGKNEVPPQVAQAALQQVLQQSRAFIDQEICTRYEPSGADFLAKSTLAGEYRPDFDSLVRMIGPNDGYKVAR